MKFCAPVAILFANPNCISFFESTILACWEPTQQLRGCESSFIRHAHRCSPRRSSYSVLHQVNTHSHKTEQAMVLHLYHAACSDLHGLPPHHQSQTQHISVMHALIECYVVCVMFVCWLRVDIVPLSVVLGALGALCLLSILTIPSVSYPCPRRL
jgi:hypothetical protein